MINKYIIPPGFKDNLNYDAFIEHKYKNNIINYFRDNGFNLIKTPLIEYSKNLDHNNLLIKTNKQRNQLSIRNDITPQVIRVASSRLAKKERPLKLCYYGEVVRKTGTMLRPERQFQQVGAEIIGSESFKADVEIINLAYESLKQIGVKNIVIEITAPFFLDSLIKKIKSKDTKNKLKKFIQLKNINNCLNLLEDEKIKRSLKILYSCSGSIKLKKTNILKLSNIIGFDNEVKRLIKIANLIKTKKNDLLNIDFFDLQKNKNYHKGIKFTFFSKHLRGEIAGGERYSLKYGKNYETAIGYTCYMDTILRSSSIKNTNKKILIPFNTNNKIRQKLINKGFNLFKSFEDNSDLKKESKKFGIKYYLLNNIVKKI